MNAMTLISRRTPSSRCEDFGRDVVTPPKPVAQPTPNADVYARYEEQMRAEAAKHKDKPRGWSGMTPNDRSQAGYEKRDATEAVFAALSDKPTPATAIAKQTGLSEAFVMKKLSDFVSEGACDYVMIKPKGFWRSIRHYVATADMLNHSERIHHNTLRGQEVSSAIYEALKKPLAVYQIISVTGCARSTVNRHMRKLAKAGKIRRDGKTTASNGNTVDLWVRA